MKKRVLGIVMVLVTVLSIAAPVLAAPPPEWDMPNVDPVIITRVADIWGAVRVDPETETYIIIQSNGNFDLPSGATLTIQKNTTVVVAAGTTIRPYNTIHVLGKLIFETNGTYHQNNNSGGITIGAGGTIDIHKGSINGMAGSGRRITIEEGGQLYLTQVQKNSIYAIDGTGKDTGVILVEKVDDTGVIGPAAAWTDETIEYTIWMNPGSGKLYYSRGYSVSVSWSENLEFVDFTVGPGVINWGFQSLNTIPETEKIEDHATFEFGNTTRNLNFDHSSTPGWEPHMITLTFKAKAVGEATLKVDSFKLWSEIDVDTPDEIIDFAVHGPFKTVIMETVYKDIFSVYDINKDEFIDFSDVVVALKAFDKSVTDETKLATALNGDVISAVQCDVNGEGSDTIDMLDIGDIIANYGKAPKTTETIRE